MSIKDVLTIIVRTFGAYHIYLVGRGVLQLIFVLASGTSTPGLTTADVALSIFVQPAFSLVIAVLVFKYQSKFVGFLMRGTADQRLHLSRKSGIMVVLYFLSFYALVDSFPSLVHDIYLYLDYTSHTAQGISVTLSAPTSAFGMPSKTNPIFAVAYDFADVALSIALFLFAHRIAGSISGKTESIEPHLTTDEQTNPA